MGEMKKMKQEEIEAAVIALGIVILIAGAKHAVASLLEQWRALVFLLLNLVVLTILFTSIHSNSNNKHLPMNTERETIDDDSNNMNEKKNKAKTTAKKKKKREINRCSWSNEPVDYVVLQSEESMASTDNENDDTCEPRLSKEELNAKAEAFILMFRQQLAFDAQRRRSSSRPSFSTNSTSSQVTTNYTQKEIPISS